MSHERFQLALGFTLKYEGGLSDHPSDRGGRTSRGITQRTYNQWLEQQSRPRADVAQITETELQAIYRTFYWRPTRCGQLPEPVDLVLFDTAVNSGPARAISLLQQEVGAEVDGLCGAQTLAATQAFVQHSSGLALASAYLDRREAFLRALAASKPSQRVFLKGWLNRVEALRSFAGVGGETRFDLSEPGPEAAALGDGGDGQPSSPRTYEEDLDLGLYLEESEEAKRSDGVFESILSAVRGAIGEVSTLRVQTFTTRASDPEGQARLRAQSHQGLDGNLEVDIPLDQDGTLNADIWRIHQDMMRVGQEHQEASAKEIAETISSFYALLIK